MRNSCLLVFLAVLMVADLSAQPISGYSYEVMLQTADKALENDDYYNAVDWFEQAYKEQRSDELAYTIAHLHMMLRDYAKAETWFARLAKSKRGAVEYPEARYYWGTMLKRGGKYKEAADALKTFADETDNDSLRTLAQLELKGIATMGSMAPYRAVDVSAIELLNCKHTDGGPALFNRNELYYTSYGSDSIIYTDDDGVEYESKIYKAAYSEEKGWEKGEPLGIHINRIGYHTGNPTFSRDRERIYFTRALMQGNRIIESKIYVSVREGSEWSGAEELLGGANGDFISRHPVIGELYGREVLFFVSDKPGGEGGYDLYYATVLAETQVDEPVNLGKVINTPMDELTPFYSDGTLFFASDGHPGMGGLDLFYTEWNGSQWSAPRNMGPGFNSPVDDMHLVLDETRENGFLVSNREGAKYLKSKTCCDDIFGVAPAKIPVNLVATIGEKRGGLRGGTIKIIELQGEREVESKTERNMEGNNFDIPLLADKSYIIVAEHPRYFPDTIRINTVGVTTAKTYEKKFTLNVKPVESEVEIITLNEPIRLNSIYYDFNDDKILKEAEKDLDKLYGLLVQYADMKIELSSHTDSRGSDEYNQKLSQRRAESAKRYLVKKGIVEDRIRAVGYGETQVLNKCANGVECTEEEHQYNRRTEFKIIEGPQTIEIRKEVVKDAATVEKERVEKERRERQQAAQAARKPVLTFDAPRATLGRMRKGDKKTHMYAFRNTGDADLVIEMVSGCECTTAEWPTRPIKPGQKGEIKITYDSKDDSGVVEKTLDVIANTVPPVTELKYKVTVVEKSN